jgi:hypothetical protein
LGLTSFVEKGSCPHGYALDPLVIELCSFKWVQEAFDGSKQLALVHGVNVLEISISSIPGVNLLKFSISTLSPFMSPYLRESAVNFVAVKHRWRWKCAAEEEMRVAEKKAAALLHSQGFKHSPKNSSKARSWAWLLRKEKILEDTGCRINLTRGNRRIICVRLCGGSLPEPILCTAGIEASGC